MKNHQFKDILDFVDLPIFVHDNELRLIYGNRAYFAEAKTSEAEAQGKYYWQVFPKQEAPLPSCNATILSGSGVKSSDEVDVGGKTFLSSGFINRDSNQHFDYALHVLHDITEPKKVLRLLTAEVQKAQTLFELSPDAIMVLNAEGFTDCNPATLKMFGCSDKQQFVGHHPSYFSPAKQYGGEDSFEFAKLKIDHALKEGNNFFEWRYKRHDGSEFDAEVLLVAFAKEQDLVLQATVRDITVRKEAERQVAETIRKRNLAIEGIVLAVSKTMGFRDQYTTLHQKRVSDISCVIAHLLNWPEERIKGLKLAALIHDLGKISTPTDILTKPSKLSYAELELVKEHAEIGYQILRDFDFPWNIAEIVRQHHERLDGSGYPRGLKGDEILPEAKIIAVADTIEAMAANRPYRESVGLDGALEEIKSGAGTRYDAEIVKAALRIFEGKQTFEDAEITAYPTT